VARDTEVLGGHLPQCHHGGKPATNHLSYGRVKVLLDKLTVAQLLKKLRNLNILLQELKWLEPNIMFF
jgi:hypothetical protein